MFYVIMLNSEHGWVQGSEIATNSQTMVNMVYGVFHRVSDEEGRVVIGTTYRNLQHALELLNSGQVCPWITFGSIRNNELVNGGALKSQELEYGAGDRDKPYQFTSAQTGDELTRWLEFRRKVLSGRMGGPNDGDDTLKAAVV